MTARAQHTGRDRSAALALVAPLLAMVTVWLGAPPATAAVPLGSVQLSVQDVSPNSPSLTNSAPQPLDVTLTLTNTTGETLEGVTISGDRGDPIFNQQDLDRAIGKPQPPSDALVSPLGTIEAPGLAPHATTGVVFHTRTDISRDAELCLCANAIYPLYFTAHIPEADGTATELDSAQTYLPSFTEPPAKSMVGWLWPLLDRPHRLAQDTVFTDDELAAEVRSGGRLDQLLTVAEQVAAKDVPLTLLTDPELIDELAVMSGINTPGGYRVQTEAGAVAGAGGTAATAWLQRLRTVLDGHGMELAFTPFADPAVESLGNNGLSWSLGLGTAAQARITLALGEGRTPLTDIAFPPGGTLSGSTLSTLAGQGTKTVVLNEKAVSRPTRSTAFDALTTVQTRRGPVVAALTSASIERSVRTVLAPNGPGLAALPELVARLAVHVVTSPHSSYVMITPPRELTVDPAVAVRAIVATSLASWASPLPLRAAVSTLKPTDRAQVRSQTGAPQLPSATVRLLRYVLNALPGVAQPGAGNFYPVANPTTTRLAAWPVAMQRCESASLLVQDPQASITRAGRLKGGLSAILRGVSLVPPSFGTYTLTSKNSHLPVTIVNRLPDDVQVKITISTLFGRAGFTADDDKVVLRTIRAGTRTQLRIPTRVDRVGRFDVQVTLSTPDGLPLGKPIGKLTVRSTALGTVGVVITVAAAIVLLLALLVRLLRRVRTNRRGKPSASPEPAPVATTLS